MASRTPEAAAAFLIESDDSALAVTH